MDTETIKLLLEHPIEVILIIAVTSWGISKIISAFIPKKKCPAKSKKQKNDSPPSTYL